jgi:chemotaxis methyl-accepting protein methylase
VAVTVRALAELIERTTGLAVDRGGVSKTLERVVDDRMRALALDRIDDYVARAADPRGAEMRLLIDAITVPHTWFYRDVEQLAAIGQLIAGAPAIS